jgi:hypothetical protein
MIALIRLHIIISRVFKFGVYVILYVFPDDGHLLSETIMEKSTTVGMTMWDSVQ